MPTTEENQLRCWRATSLGKVLDLTEICSCQEWCGSKGRWRACSSLDQTKLRRQRSCRSTFMRPAELPRSLLQSSSNKTAKDSAGSGRNNATTTHKDMHACVWRIKLKFHRLQFQTQFLQLSISKWRFELQGRWRIFNSNIELSLCSCGRYFGFCRSLVVEKTSGRINNRTQPTNPNAHTYDIGTK